jgi:hypothetical protein
MPEATFDHERLDVYRLSIGYLAFSYQIAKSLGGTKRQARDQWLRAAQSIPRNIAEGNGKQISKTKVDSSKSLGVRHWNVPRLMMSCGFAMRSTMVQTSMAKPISNESCQRSLG